MLSTSKPLMHQYNTLLAFPSTISDSEVRVKIAEERALKAEEALQEALKTIKDLEGQVQGRPSLQPRSREGAD